MWNNPTGRSRGVCGCSRGRKSYFRQSPILLMLATTPVLVFLSSQARAASDNWIGGGTDANWSTGADWLNDHTPPTNSSPIAGDNLTFNTTPTNGFLTLNNDLSSASLPTITFGATAPAFVLNGNALTLSGASNPSIVNNSTNTETINFALTLAGSRSIKAVSGPIVLGGVLSGASGMIYNGSTFPITLLAQANYVQGSAGTNGTQIQSGIVQIGTGGGLPLASAGGTSQTGAVVLGFTGGIAGTLELGDANGPVNQTVTSIRVTSGGATTSAVVGGNAGVSALMINTGAADTYSGQLGGSGTNQNNLALIKQGAGFTLTLSGNNTYIGGTNIQQGTLLVGSATALPSTGTITLGDVANDNATLDLNARTAAAGGLATLGSGATIIGNGSTSGNATLNYTGGATPSIFAGVIQDVVGVGTKTTALTVTSGSLTLSAGNTYSGNTNINGGALTLASTGTIASANITAGATATANINGLLTGTPAVTANGTVNLGAADTSNDPTSGFLVRTWNSLTIGAAGSVIVAPATTTATHTVLVTALTNTAGGKIDLSSNDLILHNADMSSVLTPGSIANQLKAGFAAGVGYWNGTTGITSSAAAGDTRFLTTLGYAAGGGTVDGVSTVSTDVLVKYTYYGDADLNGTVNGADYQQIDNGFGMGLTGWSNGDFNYDGVVNGSDFALIDNTFNQLTATGASSLAVVASPSDLIAGSALTTAVPEPTTLGLLSVGAISLLGRRRRRNAG